MADGTITAVELEQAVADTEKEIFDEATGSDPLEATGDTSLEQMDDDTGDDGDAADDSDTGDQDESEAQPEPKGDVKAEPPRDETGKFVPAQRLREQSQARKAAEAERDALKTEMENFRREFDALKTGLTRPATTPQQQQQPQEPQVPDMFADPEGYNKYVQTQAVQSARKMFTEASFDDAREQHGAETFSKAYSDLMATAQAEAQQFGGKSPAVAKILNAPNPGRALMNWHKENSAIREVGSDPKAWFDKQLEARMSDPEFQAKLLGRVRETAKANGASTTRLPPSLNSMTGGSQHRGNGDPELYNNSEDSVMAFALNK